MKVAKTWHEGHAADYIVGLVFFARKNKLSARVVEAALMLDRRVPTKEECEEIVSSETCSNSLKGRFVYLVELLNGGRYGGLR